MAVSVDYCMHCFHLRILHKNTNFFLASYCHVITRFYQNYINPLLLGSLYENGSRRIAAFNAFAKAFMIASILWCSFSPRAYICRLQRAP